jgi:hypothetical protein
MNFRKGQREAARREARRMAEIERQRPAAQPEQERRKVTEEKP